MGKETSSQWLSPNFVLVLEVLDMMHVVKVFYWIKKILLLINYRAKHPVKVHVWAGISIRGRTGMCIFDGIMRASLYAEILKETLFPFIIVFSLITVICRTTTPNTTLDWSRLSLALMVSIGGGRHQNRRMPIRLKIFGMN